MNVHVQEFLYSIKSEKSQLLYEYYIEYFARFAKIEIQDLLDLPIEKIQKYLSSFIFNQKFVASDFMDSPVKGDLRF
jgi:hypothetical protein